MNARTIRRASQRKAQKQARKEERNEEEVVTTFPSALAPSAAGIEVENGLPCLGTPSAAQLAANRRNSQFSTGPVTAAGKARSSGNALKTGLTGRTVLLSSDDAVLYEQHVQSVFRNLQPVGDRETELVQAIADSKWRFFRIPSLEFGIYALGRIQFAEEFHHLSSAEAAALVEAKTFLAYERQLNNLRIQEGRLHRQHDKDMLELVRLQQLREKTQLVVPSTSAVSSTRSSAPGGIGFEISTAVFHPASRKTVPEAGRLTLPNAA